MTQKFNVHNQCHCCGAQYSAETAFGRWMRANQALDSVNGIVRTDCDHIILRYKTSLDQRDFQMLMFVEVKEHGAEPDPAQLDVLHFTHQLLVEKGTNRYCERTWKTIRMKSVINGRIVRVKCFGVHLLQFENTNPDNSRWIKWDRKPITKQVLEGVLALERRPDNPEKWMVEFLRDRHRKPSAPMLFQMQPT